MPSRTSGQWRNGHAPEIFGNGHLCRTAPERRLLCRQDQILEQFLDAPDKVTLFIRPRRFGKTLFMSMLSEFFDIKKQGNGQNLFEGLAVAENEKICQEWMRQHPVISITLKNVDKNTFEAALNKIKDIVREICISSNELLDSSKIDSEERKDLKLLHTKKADIETLCNALFTLTNVMCKHYEKPVILLIDEYDVPVAKAAEKGYYDEMNEFMCNFISEALKTNPSLEFAILTGA